MSNEVEEPFSLVASLEAGPPGKLRVRYRFSDAGVFALLPRRISPREWRRSLPSYLVEIDRTKLHKLQFSQRELAEIGFGLVSQLCALEHCRSAVENT